MNLKAIREARNMSREALAEAVGVSLFTLRNWEQGQREPSIAHLVDLADALGCTVDALVRSPGPIPPTDERMAEKLRIHREIEEADRRHTEDWKQRREVNRDERE